MNEFFFLLFFIFNLLINSLRFFLFFNELKYFFLRKLNKDKFSLILQKKKNIARSSGLLKSNLHPRTLNYFMKNIFTERISLSRAAWGIKYIYISFDSVIFFREARSLPFGKSFQHINILYVNFGISRVHGDGHRILFRSRINLAVRGDASTGGLRRNASEISEMGNGADREIIGKRRGHTARPWARSDVRKKGVSTNKSYAATRPRNMILSDRSRKLCHRFSVFNKVSDVIIRISKFTWNTRTRGCDHSNIDSLKSDGSFTRTVTIVSTCTFTIFAPCTRELTNNRHIYMYILCASLSC
ncbi:hypothetical protein PUN28_008669 [Cardiocondyla obscurior]|uniref:Uncharacterized protein n=1 Tax=Cardiocondyla obscurior TaxID=286306 RepID=A0AAW2G0Z9_9HYME